MVTSRLSSSEPRHDELDGITTVAEVGIVFTEDDIRAYQDDVRRLMSDSSARVRATQIFTRQMHAIVIEAELHD